MLPAVDYGYFAYGPNLTEILLEKGQSDTALALNQSTSEQCGSLLLPTTGQSGCMKVPTCMPLRDPVV